MNDVKRVIIPGRCFPQGPAHGNNNVPRSKTHHGDPRSHCLFNGSSELTKRRINRHPIECVIKPHERIVRFEEKSP